MDFNGTNEAVNLTGSGTLAALNGVAAATLSCWAELDTASTNRLFEIGPGGAPSSTCRMSIDRSGTGQIENLTRAPDGATFLVADPGAVPVIGTQYCHAITANIAGDNQKIYRNGAQRLSTAAAFAPAAFTASNSGCGAVASSGDLSIEFTDGRIEDCRIYTRELSANEQSTIYACRGHDGIWFGLANRWRLTEGPPGTTPAAGNTIPDISNQKWYAAPFNTPTYEQTRLSYRRRYP